MENPEACIGEKRTWLADNHVKLNGDKTEFTVIGQKHNLGKIGKEMSITTIGNAVIRASSSVKNIGATVDSHMDMKIHVHCVS